MVGGEAKAENVAGGGLNFCPPKVAVTATFEPPIPESCGARNFRAGCIMQDQNDTHPISLAAWTGPGCKCISQASSLCGHCGGDARQAQGAPRRRGRARPEK